MSALPDGGRVAVTGSTGFVGSTLVRMMAAQGFTVVGIDRSTGSLDVDASLAAHHRVDLTAHALSDVEPDLDAVVHLAGMAQVGGSFDRPQDYIESTSAMMTHLCEGLLARRSSARVVVASSGAVYGGGRSTVSSFDEDSPVDFSSPYVVAKVLLENQAAYYRRRGLDVVVARPFNHIGPGQRPGFLVPDLLQKLRALAPGATLETGPLSSSRDYTDVRDVAAAYVALATAPSLDHATYNIASGRPFTGHEILRLVVDALGIEMPPVRESESRAIDPNQVSGDASRLRAATRWEPAIAIEESVRAFVESATGVPASAESQ